MSAARDKFNELLVPKIEASGFKPKSGKSVFIKTQNGIEYKISFRWDGRGGVTMLDSIEVEITDLAAQKEIKKQIEENCAIPVFTLFGYVGVGENNIKIPVMYSSKALDLANNMNFKALSQLPQDEKYPPERIVNSVNFVENMMLTKVIPFCEAIKTPLDIYNHLFMQTEKLTNKEDISSQFLYWLPYYSKTLGLPLPKLLQE